MTNEGVFSVLLFFYSRRNFDFKLKKQYENNFIF